MRVVIVDYGRGNLHSVCKAVQAAASKVALDVRVQLSDSAGDILSADKLVVPGVGAFASCMSGLNSVSGVRDALDKAVLVRRIPVFGICVGMQIMATQGHEFGVTEGLGWIDGKVTAIPRQNGLRVPHMSWQQVRVDVSHDVVSPMWAYFVHSFCFETNSLTETLATTEYGSRFAAVVGRDNIIGTQFHPEKSQRDGLAMLQRFLEWHPR